jgi:hypothetical protein
VLVQQRKHLPQEYSVRSGGNDVAELERVVLNLGGDETRNMGHVHPAQMRPGQLALRSLRYRRVTHIR